MKEEEGEKIGVPHAFRRTDRRIYDIQLLFFSSTMQNERCRFEEFYRGSGETNEHF